MSKESNPPQIEIRLWDPIYKEDFIRFNRQWIETYFCLEPSDLKILGDPEGIIIRPGGQIFIALLEGVPAGCCALVFHPGTRQYELAKMAVDPSAQGHGAGTLLGEALIAYARSLGIRRLFLEANTKLEASVKLYHKLGFRPIEADHPAYARCNLYMEKLL